MRHRGVGHDTRFGEIRDVEDFQTVAVHDEGVAELHGDPARIMERGSADRGGDAGGERIVEVHDDE